MNKDIFEGQWKKVKGNVKEQWGKLTDDDLTKINGKRDQLLGAIQTRYGYAKDKAEDELNKFEKKWAHNANHSEHTHDARAVDDDV
jgi:uncharacterized protein YjbJ (UPF0337 family)